MSQVNDIFQKQYRRLLGIRGKGEPLNDHIRHEATCEAAENAAISMHPLGDILKRGPWNTPGVGFEIPIAVEFDEDREPLTVRLYQLQNGELMSPGIAMKLPPIAPRYGWGWYRGKNEAACRSLRLKKMSDLEGQKAIASGES